MQTPYDLKIEFYYSGSVEISWVGILPNDSYTYVIEALNYENSLWQEAGVTRINSTVIAGSYSAVRVYTRNSENFADKSDYSAILPINIKATSNMHEAILPGIDDSGRHTFLATTPEGVLKITGATVTNYGGDASAANQLTEISAANEISSKLSNAISAINAIIAQLNSLGLSAAVISALQNISVNNLPGDFPDTNALAELQDLNNFVAKDTSINNAIDAINSLFKPSDISLDGDRRVNANIANLPSNYPNIDLQAAASQANLHLENADNALSAINNSLSEISPEIANLDLNAALISNKLTDTLTLLDTLDHKAFDTLTTADVIRTIADDIAEETSQIALALANKLNTTDISFDANGAVNINANNMPSDFPDSAALSALLQIKNHLQLLTQGISANIANALPAGNNTIGRVSVNNAILPENAATESTLNSAANLLLEFYNAMKATPNILMAIKNLALSIDESVGVLTLNRKKLIDASFSLLNGPVEMRVLDYISPDMADINNWPAYDILVFTYGTAISAKLRIESAYEGQNFYHSISEQIINAGAMKSFELNIPIQNISLKITEPIANTNALARGARVCVYGRRQ